MTDRVVVYNSQFDRMWDTLLWQHPWWSVVICLVLVGIVFWCAKE